MEKIGAFKSNNVCTHNDNSSKNYVTRNFTTFKYSLVRGNNLIKFECEFHPLVYDFEVKVIMLEWMKRKKYMHSSPLFRGLVHLCVTRCWFMEKNSRRRSFSVLFCRLIITIWESERKHKSDKERERKRENHSKTKPKLNFFSCI